MAAIVDLNELRQLRATLPRERADQVDVNEMVAQAAIAFGDGDAAGAERVLQAAVMLDQEDPDAWALMGNIEETLGCLEEARIAYGHALSLNPSDSDSAFALAALQERMGDLGPAKSTLNWMLLQFDDADVIDRAAAEFNRLQDEETK